MSLAQIPKEWSQVVCQCPKAFEGETQLGYPKRIFRDDSTRLFTCRICRRPSSHCIYRCINCTAVFLKDFGHPLWLLDQPNCWICLEADESRATRILAASKSSTDERIPPQLRKLYISITEGFDAEKFSFDIDFI